MPKEVECPMSTCIYNENKLCLYPKNITLKWRLAADMGSGNVVMLECLQMEIAMPGGVA
jgi:hypothetical protein